MGDFSIQPRRIVIIGGGIVGCATAYCLSRHPLFRPGTHTVTLLEATAVGSGASGKAGGLLAEWATPKCLAPLSFKTHAQLAARHGGAEGWGYRHVQFAEVAVRPTQGGQAGSRQDAILPGDLDWLEPGGVLSYTETGNPANTAQVDPYRLTNSLAELAQEANAEFFTGTASSINYQKNGAVGSVTFTTTSGQRSTIEATDVVVAAGPWSSSLLPSIKLLAPRGHSVIAEPGRTLSAYVVEATIDAAPGSPLAKLPGPGLYPRPPEAGRPLDTMYACGPDDYEAPLPPSTADVAVVGSKCDSVWRAAGAVSSAVREGEVLVRQACHKAQIRPHADGEEVGPILGPGRPPGLWIATGFDEWGIQNGPGAGLVMSEMILEGGSQSADYDSLHPRHFFSWVE